MSINQLFKEKPPLEFLEEVLTLFGLNSINDTHEFSKVDKIIDETFYDRFYELKDKFLKYYLKCKLDLYFNRNKLTFTRIITILRHCVKLYNYKITSYERYFNGKKTLAYNIDICPLIKKHQIDSNKCTIIFD